MMDMQLNMNSTLHTFDVDSKWDQSTIRTVFGSSGPSCVSMDGPSDGGCVSMENEGGGLMDKIREGHAPSPQYPPCRISRRSQSSRLS
mmetsp:Transcript_20342/g.36550  ORF Transcript_20342/g.36550 Transcript_20342/m.36550 type:complete len:88 (+) Transcript_20342:390-653(+)